MDFRMTHIEMQVIHPSFSSSIQFRLTCETRKHQAVVNPDGSFRKYCKFTSSLQSVHPHTISPLKQHNHFFSPVTFPPLSSCIPIVSGASGNSSNYKAHSLAHHPFKRNQQANQTIKHTFSLLGRTTTLLASPTTTISRPLVLPLLHSLVLHTLMIRLSRRVILRLATFPLAASGRGGERATCEER